ncbi:MAG: hypothetical protein IPQ07_36140 [Myxococcales bacterium]|nr:hypothetical protein [Myxococcales bacterium]
MSAFPIPVEGLPLKFTLFAIDENKYSLRFLAKDGWSTLSDGTGRVNTLGARSKSGRGATNNGEYFQVPLGDAARGKLSARRSRDRSGSSPSHRDGPSRCCPPSGAWRSRTAAIRAAPA